MKQFAIHIRTFFPALLALIPSLSAAAPEDAAEQMHWAFRAVIRKEAPSSQAKNPIDAFIQNRLESENISPSPEADPATLLRRLYLDLTGLIPGPGESQTFLSAWEKNPKEAYSNLVESLLASPHFGEHWGRHWLDLARYADSDGYLGDTARIWAWVYRDWVIAAINRDQPFDQFSIEQLAGDLLPRPSLEQKITTGFHRNTLHNTEAGVDKELYRTKEVVDRVNTTGGVFLGLTLGCAECHDHKHDPISQKEFYQLYAFFNNTDESSVKLPMSPELKAYARANLSEKEKKKNPAPPLKALAPVLRERTKDRRPNQIHIRGEYTRPGEVVTPGTPAVLNPLECKNKMPNRLDLARWLFDEKNPLTARVAVNRIWQYLFGVGIVTTPDDFGTAGARPTHPELLDWLASEYRRLGWSRKEIIRLIVHSSTYRQSSVVRPELANHPTGNRLFWRQNSHRVSAETVRDIHLLASGLLNNKIGGPGSIRPPLPAFVAEVGRSVKWPESKGPDRYRRGVYIFLKRTVMYPMLTTFDAPDASLSCSRRDRTNTSMQALTLLNDPVFFECSEKLGSEVYQRHLNAVGPAIDELFQTCLNRPPSDEEKHTLLAAHDDLIATTKTPEDAMIATARIIFNLDEFISRN